MPKKQKKCDTEKEFINKTFDLGDQEIIEMNKFMADHKRRSAKEFFDEVFDEPSFGTREKMAISYMVGRFMKEAFDIRMETLKESIVDAIVNYQKNEKKEETGESTAMP